MILTRLQAFLFVLAFISGFFTVGGIAGEDYPDLYDKELPRYPTADLVSTGRQTSSLEDGLRLQLESRDSLSTIAAYFEDKMGELGWSVPAQHFPNDTMYLNTFTKGKLYYQLTIMRLSNKDTTQIEIIYAKH